MNRPRVVITGLGTINPLGHSVEKYWEGLTSGLSGIGPITLFDASELPCRIAGEVKDFNPQDYFDRKEARRTPRASQLAIAAAREAVQDAEMTNGAVDPERLGVLFGTGVAGAENIVTATIVLRTQGYKKMNPFGLPSGIPNMPAAMIAREFQCLGPNNTTATACAAGTQSVGEGAELIRRGVADMVITGGTEAIVLDTTIGGFSVMRALPVNYNDRPEAASRPFDIEREGFVLAEGSAVLVLEELNHALPRGANIYAEVLGHASSSDAYHVAALNPDGLGPSRAMQWALNDAGIQLGEVNYINAHGTSTPMNDVTETRAIKQVFGEYAYDVKISSTKSMMGHAMGASGALEAIACTLAIRDNLLPPTINYDQPDPECDLYYVPNEAEATQVDITMSNSFGLGGQNACLVLRKFNQNEEK